MKILLIAYGFGAGRGSEPGVGWNVARLLSLRGHQVTVISSTNFLEENTQAIQNEHLNIKHIAHDFPKSRWTRSYKIWQRNIGKIIQEESIRQKYDIIHHITFNQYRSIRDVFYTNLPALIGPVGGAEVIPLPLLGYGGLPLAMILKEAMRYLPWDAIPLIHRAKKAANKLVILCANRITADRLGKGLIRFKGSIRTAPAIAIHENEICTNAEPDTDSPFILFDGGLSRPQKGTWLMLGALKRLWLRGCRIPVRIVGLKAPEMTFIFNRATRMGLPAEALILQNAVPRSEMLQLMQKSTIMLSTVYRDSGAMALLEALAQGTRIVCLDIPSQQWLTPDMATKIRIYRNRNKMETALAEALQQQIEAPSPSQEWNNLRITFLKEHMTWESRVKLFEAIYNDLIDKT